VISDMKMPHMNGERLHRSLSRTHPELARRIVWTTGDTLGGAAEELARRTGSPLLRKPFDLDELGRAVRDGLADRRD
jgi:two-component system NtrC family sensor kinase